MSTNSLTAEATGESPFHLGDRIRKAWELAGYSDATAFAAAAELDRGAVTRYMRTGVVPRRSTLIAIAWHTPVRLEWLETGEGPVFKEPGPGDVHPLGLEPRTHWFSGVKSKVKGPSELIPIEHAFDIRESRRLAVA